MRNMKGFINLFTCLTVLMAAAVCTGCDHIDNKSVPRFTVRIDLGSFALWNTYGVHGMGQYRIFNREKNIPAWIDYWGYDVNHDWPWWRKQMPYFLGNVLGQP